MAGVQRCALKCRQTDKESDRQTNSNSDLPIDTKTCFLMALYTLNTSEAPILRVLAKDYGRHVRRENDRQTDYRL